MFHAYFISPFAGTVLQVRLNSSRKCKAGGHLLFFFFDGSEIETRTCSRKGRDLKENPLPPGEVKKKKTVEYGRE